MNKLVCILLLPFALGACGQAPDPGSPFSSRDDEWQAAMNAGDADGIAALYTEDARLMPPNGAATIGRDAVSATFNEMIESGVKAELTPIETQSSGDVAYNVGTYVLTVAGEVTDRGKYVETWRRGADGAWLMSNDIWNSDLPAAGSSGELTHVMVYHEVEDFDRWIAAWRGDDSRRDLFAANGVAYARTFQNAENPNLTGLVMSISDMEAFDAFMATEEIAEAAAADGVDLGETTILVEVE